MNAFKRALCKFGAKEMFVEFLRKRMLFQIFLGILLYGLDQSSLELVRLGAKNKFKKRLMKKYSYVIEQKRTRINAVQEIPESTIWVCWYSGLDNAPVLVQRCVQSIKDNFDNVVVLTDENMHEYVSFPKFVMNKRKSGAITPTHFSDLLRVELLSTYGGTWIDATVFVSSNDLPKAFKESEIFFFQNLKPGKNGDAVSLSSWYIQAKKENEIMMLTREFLFEYWRKKNYLVDYFLFHHFMSISRDIYEKKGLVVPKFSNSVPHMLLLELFEKYDAKRFEDILKATPVHKLSYKSVPNSVSNTYYNYILSFNKNEKL